MPIFKTVPRPTFGVTLTCLHHPKTIIFFIKSNFGKVYKAKHKVTKEFVAIKILQMGEDEATLKKLQSEIKCMKECDSINIVKYFGSYIKDSDLWVSYFSIMGKMIHELK